MAGHNAVDHAHDSVDILLLHIAVPGTAVEPLVGVKEEIFVQDKIS